MNTKFNIETLLPLVQKPARYTDHELNSHRPDPGRDARICFCFPDVYELGASNLGIEILYHTVNLGTTASAERCYCPEKDMETLMRQNSVPLFSIESKTPLAEFDVIGFTMQHELSITNVLNMLDLAGLAVRADERAAAFPLVIAGGPVTANPEPYAEFFDLFVIGEGEEVIGELLQKIAGAKKAGVNNKTEFLVGLSQIEGIYVPSLYDVSYEPGGAVKAVTPKYRSVPSMIKKRVVKLDQAFFPAKQIVPFLQTVHNRLNIELARGCPRQCRFCQAARYYAPWRMRSLEQVKGLVETGLASTGFEEVAFSSLSCTDYRDIAALLEDTNKRFASKRINVSLPSMRCDKFSMAIASNVNQNKRSGLTFAPEAGSERLRAYIGKPISDSQILETLTLAYNLGWRSIKLYFMLGLPTETDEDIRAIASLVNSAKRIAGDLNFNITLSPFVPKAQTVFQWVSMEKYDIIKTRMFWLKKELRAQVKAHYIEASVLEGIFSRGDRRLARGILNAWKKGCGFDQWKEHLNFDLWEAAFREEKLDPKFYHERERAPEEVLPWDHIGFFSEKAQLKKELQTERQVIQAGSPDLPEIRRPQARLPKSMPLSVQRLRFRFARQGAARFISHLDQIEVFRRTVRRSGLPVNFTSGFSPQPKMAFGPAISVGYESQSEFVDVELIERLDLDKASEMAQKALPQGFRLLSVKKVPLFCPALDSSISVADYLIDFILSPETIRDFLSRDKVIVIKKKQNKTLELDARPLIKELRQDPNGLYMRLVFGPKKTIKPEAVLEAAAGISETEAKSLRVTRLALFVEKSDGTIVEP
jgi:radical SAM family uncharacterized protein/radical SAM-linked protein